MREGIAALIRSFPDLALIGEAANGREAVEKFRALRPDVTLIDLQMPVMSGVDAIAAICRDDPQARIVVLTTYQGEAQVRAALRAGANAYLLKSMVMLDLVETIRAVHAGRRRIPAEIAIEMAEYSERDALSLRELEVLRLVAVGTSNREIAISLAISEETVKVHMRHILEKLAANDRTHAVTIAIKRGIINI